MTITVFGVCGNPRAGSRTLAVVTAAVAAVAREGRAQDAGCLDLIELRDELFSFGAAGVQLALERVMQADILVFGTPVYKASYTGVLKAFCDHIAHDQLAGKLAIPLMVGGSLQHYLALEIHLRPLLVELGATCATPGLYVVESELEQLDAQLATYVESITNDRSLTRFGTATSMDFAGSNEQFVAGRGGVRGREGDVCETPRMTISTS